MKQKVKVSHGKQGPQEKEEMECNQKVRRSCLLWKFGSEFISGQKSTTHKNKIRQFLQRTGIFVTLSLFSFFLIYHRLYLWAQLTARSTVQHHMHDSRSRSLMLTVVQALCSCLTHILSFSLLKRLMGMDHQDPQFRDVETDAQRVR